MFARPRLVGLAAAALILCLGVQAQAQRRARIGLVADGPWDRNVEVLTVFMDEIRGLLEPEFTVSLDLENVRTGDWTLEGVSQHVDALLADRDIDVVLTVGPIASTYICRLGRLPKPVVAAFVLDPEIQGIPLAERGSGVHNLSYVTFASSIENDVRAFQDVVSFRRLTFLVNDGMSAEVPELMANISFAVSGLGVEVSTIRVGGGSVDEVIAQLDDAVEAVYVYPLMQLSNGDYRQLIDALIERRIPSFSAWGRSEVEAGLLMSTYPDADFQRIARRVALNVQRILLGDRAATLPVHFSRGEQFTLNMATARALRVYPTWAVLTEAELIHGERTEGAREIGLFEAMEEAVRVNLELATAQLGLDATAEDVRQARSLLLPQLDLTLQGSVIDSDRAAASLGSASQFTGTATVGLTQIIYSEGAWANRDIQGSLYQSAEQELERLRLDIAEATAVGFVDVLRAKTFERIQRENLNLTRQHLELARIREGIGTAGPGDIYRWEAEVANNRQSVISANAQRNQAEMQLNRLLNRPLEESFVTVNVDDDVNAAMFSNEIMEPYFDNPWGFRVLRDFMTYEALTNSPELRQLDANIAAQERALLASDRAFYVPDVSLFGETSASLHGGEGSDGNTLFDDLPPGVEIDAPPEADDFDFLLGIGLSFPLYAGGARYSEQDEAHIELTQLRSQREVTAQLIEQRVRSALHAAGASYAAIGLAADAKEAARASMALVSDAYARGAVSVSDLIDAQNAFLVAEEMAANAVFNHLRNYMQAQRTTGFFVIFLDETEQVAFFTRLQAFFENAEAHSKDNQ